MTNAALELQFESSDDPPNVEVNEASSSGDLPDLSVLLPDYVDETFDNDISQNIVGANNVGAQRHDLDPVEPTISRSCLRCMSCHAPISIFGLTTVGPIVVPPNRRAIPAQTQEPLKGKSKGRGHDRRRHNRPQKGGTKGRIGKGKGSNPGKNRGMRHRHV